MRWCYYHPGYREPKVLGWKPCTTGSNVQVWTKTQISQQDFLPPSLEYSSVMTVVTTSQAVFWSPVTMLSITPFCFLQPRAFTPESTAYRQGRECAPAGRQQRARSCLSCLPSMVLGHHSGLPCSLKLNHGNFLILSWPSSVVQNNGSINMDDYIAQHPAPLQKARE